MQWIKASERLPKYRAAAKYGKRYGEVVPNDIYIEFHALGTSVTVNYNSPSLKDIEWLDESSPASPEMQIMSEESRKAYNKLWDECQDYKTEIERLKQLVKDAWWTHAYNSKQWNTSKYDAAWQQFKTDNQL